MFFGRNCVWKYNSRWVAKIWISNAKMCFNFLVKPFRIVQNNHFIMHVKKFPKWFPAIFFNTSIPPCTGPVLVSTTGLLPLRFLLHDRWCDTERTGAGPKTGGAGAPSPGMAQISEQMLGPGFRDISSQGKKKRNIGVRHFWGNCLLDFCLKKVLKKAKVPHQTWVYARYCTIKIYLPSNNKQKTLRI